MMAVASEAQHQLGLVAWDKVLTITKWVAGQQRRSRGAAISQEGAVGRQQAEATEGAVHSGSKLEAGKERAARTSTSCSAVARCRVRSRP